MHETDRCVKLSIPLRVTAMAALWGAGALLLAWHTLLNGPVGAVGWGVALMTVAQTITFVHFLTVHHRTLRQAFDLGIEVGKRSLTAVE